MADLRVLWSLGLKIRFVHIFGGTGSQEMVSSFVGGCQTYLANNVFSWAFCTRFSFIKHGTPSLNCSKYKKLIYAYFAMLPGYVECCCDTFSPIFEQVVIIIFVSTCFSDECFQS